MTETLWSHKMPYLGLNLWEFFWSWLLMELFWYVNKHPWMRLGGGSGLVAKPYLTLLWRGRLSSARLLCSWDFPGKNMGVGCHFLLQRIFPIQGLNPSLLHCKWSLALQVVSGIAGGLWHCWWSQALQVVCTAGRFLTDWATRKAQMKLESPGKPRWGLTWLKLGPNSFFRKHCPRGNLVLS